MKLRVRTLRSTSPAGSITVAHATSVLTAASIYVVIGLVLGTALYELTSNSNAATGAFGLSLMSLGAAIGIRLLARRSLGA